MKKKHQDNLVVTRAVSESERARIEPQGMGTALQNHPEEAGRRQGTRRPLFWNTTLLAKPTSNSPYGVTQETKVRTPSRFHAKVH